jgi:UTP--glucose-1-phosphate uridylyltransferase
MLTLMREDGFKGLRFKGTTYDCGSKIGFLAANLAYGLEREDLGPLLRDRARTLLS